MSMRLAVLQTVNMEQFNSVILASKHVQESDILHSLTAVWTWHDHEGQFWIDTKLISGIKKITNELGFVSAEHLLICPFKKSKQTY